MELIRKRQGALWIGMLKAIVAIHLLCVCSVASIHPWILRTIENNNDYFLANSFECSESKWFVPFFLDVSSDPTTQKHIDELYEERGKENRAEDPHFVSGGYIFRLRFEDASLYALSGGWWESTGRWYSPELKKEIKVSHDKVWRGDPTESFSYASFLPGSHPAFVYYSRDGEEIERLAFEPEDDLGIEASIAKFKNRAKPALEMKLLAEYLRGDAGTWRPVEMGMLNFRNQQSSAREKELLEELRPLTLTEATQLLNGKVHRPLKATK